jgi:hypothetical protein
MVLVARKRPVAGKANYAMEVADLEIIARDTRLALQHGITPRPLRSNTFIMRKKPRR